jgi:putative transposase
MPLGLKRYQGTKQPHFVTFSTYQRLPLLTQSWMRDLFLQCVEQTRRKYRFLVYGYVVMPEHVHLLMSEPENTLLFKAIQALKIALSRRAMRYRSAGVGPFWQKRYYDHNVRSHESFEAKLGYMHRNPVKRGLVPKAEDWNWSSFRHYAMREFGVVEIESQWTADRKNGRVAKLLRSD